MSRHSPRRSRRSPSPVRNHLLLRRSLSPWSWSPLPRCLAAMVRWPQRIWKSILLLWCRNMSPNLELGARGRHREIWWAIWRRLQGMRTTTSLCLSSTIECLVKMVGPILWNLTFGWRNVRFPRSLGEPGLYCLLPPQRWQPNQPSQPSQPSHPSQPVVKPVTACLALPLKKRRSMMTTGSSSSLLASHQQPHLQVLCLVLLQRPLTARNAWTSGKDFGGVCASASMHFLGSCYQSMFGVRYIVCSSGQCVQERAVKRHQSFVLSFVVKLWSVHVLLPTVDNIHQFKLTSHEAWNLATQYICLQRWHWRCSHGQVSGRVRGLYIGFPKFPHCLLTCILFFWFLCWDRIHHFA